MKPARWLALATLEGLPPGSGGARASLDARLAMLPAHGITGVLAWGDAPAIRAAGLAWHALARLETPSDAEPLVARHAGEGAASTSLHVGTAFDDDSQLDRYADAVLSAAERHRHPVLVETHRATVTQDAWRTLRWVARFPSLQFALDASHWVVAGELDYGGGFDAHLPLLDPILRRSPVVQGRIASGGAIQVGVDDPGPWRAQAMALWARAFALRRREAPLDPVVFCPELLPHVTGEPPRWIGYAPVRRRDTEPLGIQETTDRFAEALQLFELADHCAGQAPTLG